jgi:hypothetical protein
MSKFVENCRKIAKLYAIYMKFSNLVTIFFSFRMNNSIQSFILTGSGAGRRGILLTGVLMPEGYHRRARGRSAFDNDVPLADRLSFCKCFWTASRARRA